jgi:putative RNA 2'-phosphotransferase
MRHTHSIDKLSKMLVYILGRQPDEFGLCNDENGYVKIKDLIKALAEEPGWRHVRLNQIREVFYTSRSPGVEMADNRIRAVDRSHLPLLQIPDTFPKLLYYPIRQRAHPVVLEKGIPLLSGGNRIVMAKTTAMAERLGRRIGPSPVILTVHTHNARANGATLWRFGNALFLSDCLPLGSFSGPPLPKQKPASKKVAPPQPQPAPKTPGSYLLDLPIAPTDKSRSTKRSRKNEWKRERKRKSRNRGI